MRTMPLGATAHRRAGSLLAVLVCAAGVVAAMASGWLLTGALREPAVTARESSVASIGGVRLELSPVWTPGHAAPGSPGVTIFAPAPGLAAQALIASGPAADASLVPAALRSVLPDRLPAPRRAGLAGLRAWRYGPVEHSGRRVEVTVAPTTTGSLAVACSAPPEVWRVALGCASGVRRITTASAPPAPARDLSFRRRAAPALRALEARRIPLRSALARARRSAGRRAAARRLARTHRAVATALAPFAVPGASADAVAALRRAAVGYERLAGASRPRARARYLAARRVVARADAALARSLKRLRAR